MALSAPQRGQVGLVDSAMFYSDATSPGVVRMFAERGSPGNNAQIKATDWRDHERIRSAEGSDVILSPGRRGDGNRE